MSDLNPYEEGLALELKAAQKRIKWLKEELQDAEDRSNGFATKEYYTEIRAKRAEAKLAKAVEALEAIISECVGDHHRCGSRAALAELKGQDDE